jgi:hypothetical protein
MRNQQVKLTVGVAGIAVAMALVPAAPAWAGLAKSSQKSHSNHRSHSKKKGKTKAETASCPAASELAAAAGTTYTEVASQPGFDKGWVVCNYDTSGEDSLEVSLYTTGFPLREVSGNAAGPTTKVSGIGNGASHFGTIVYVQRNSAPSFSVIDESGNLTLSQTEAIAKTIAG